MFKKNYSTKPGRHDTRIYVQGRVVGTVRNGVFRKVIRDNHFLQKPLAIAFSIDSLHQAEQAGATRVEVIHKESGTMYQATITTIRTHGLPLQRGYEAQLALPLEKWTIQRQGQAHQPNLFEGLA